MYTRFLEHFLPASAVLDENDNVLHLFGNYTDYLTLAPGKATLNFFSMLNKDLTLVANTALSRSRAEQTAITYTDIAVDCPSGRRVIDLTVQPVPSDQDTERKLTAVLFLENRPAELAGVTEKYDLDATAARRIAELEREFQVSQSDLRSTIQRLETVNGELQAANEELLTANEELQSSTEELQSVNEELYTVNTEHQLKLDELTMMTNDLSNFLSSTMIGILFVDSNLNIRKFTEYVGREFPGRGHRGRLQDRAQGPGLHRPGGDGHERAVLHPAHRPLPHHGEQHPGPGHHHHRQPGRPVRPGTRAKRRRESSLTAGTILPSPAPA